MTAECGGKMNKRVFIAFLIFISKSLVMAAPVDCSPTRDLVENKKIELIREYILSADLDQLIIVTNCILPELRDKVDDFEILQALTYFDNRDQREYFLKKIEKFKKGSWEYQESLSKVINPDPPSSVPNGYTLVKESIGQGKYSYVSLIRRDSDHQLFAWKRKTGVQSNHGDAYRRHVNLHILWQALGVTDAEMILLKSKDEEETILHRLVSGRTLKREVEHQNFFKNTNSIQFQTLLDLVETMVKNRIVLLDLNAKNIVFDGERWEVIDSQRPKIFATVQDAFEGARKLFTEKWTNYSNGVSSSGVKNFFEMFESERLPSILNFEASKTAHAIAAEVLEKQNDGRLLDDVAVSHCELILIN